MPLPRAGCGGSAPAPRSRRDRSSVRGKPFDARLRGARMGRIGQRRNRGTTRARAPVHVRRLMGAVAGIASRNPADHENRDRPNGIAHGSARPGRASHVVRRRRRAAAKPGLCDCALLDFPFHREHLTVTACGRLDNLPSCERSSDCTTRRLSAPSCSTRSSVGEQPAPHGCSATSPSRSGTSPRAELFLARDRFGATPLFYTGGAWGVAFASQIDALLDLPRVSADPDPRRVAEYIADLPFDPGSTFYRSIRTVPPAHGVFVRPDRPARIAIGSSPRRRACPWETGRIRSRVPTTVRACGRPLHRRLEQHGHPPQRRAGLIVDRVHRRPAREASRDIHGGLARSSDLRRATVRGGNRGSDWRGRDIHGSNEPRFLAGASRACAARR